MKNKKKKSKKKVEQTTTSSVQTTAEKVEVIEEDLNAMARKKLQQANDEVQKGTLPFPGFQLHISPSR
jgi:outer membrane murein-binding lipoprotein Lpp